LAEFFLTICDKKLFLRIQVNKTYIDYVGNIYCSRVEENEGIHYVIPCDTIRYDKEFALKNWQPFNLI